MIAQDLFANCSSITELVIPSGVTSIAQGALFGCYSLQSLTLSSNLIPEGCSGVQTGGDTYSGLSCLFANTSDLYDNYNSYLPTNLKKINMTTGNSLSKGAFVGCENLTEINLPDNLTKIGASMFVNCSALTELVIPSSVTSIAYGALADCSSLEKLTVPSTSIFPIEGSNFETSGLSSFFYFGYNYWAYAGNDYVPSSLTEIVILNGTEIPNYSFVGCSSLISIEIPSSVTSIGDYAFHYCSGLTELIIPEGVTSIGAGALQNLSSVEHLVIPSTVTSLPNTNTDNAPLQGTSNLKTLECSADVIPYGDIYGGAYSGLNCLYGYWDYDNWNWIGKGSPSSLTKIILNGGTSIRSGAFCYSRLTSIEISSSVTSIGGYAFFYCYNLTSVTFGENSHLTSIGDYAFFDCNSLTSIEIPSSVTSIGEWAFSGCSSLTSVTFGENSRLTSIGSYAFEGCSKLTSIEIPSSVASIGDAAFAGCSSLTSITLPSSVARIGSSAFDGCYSLVQVRNLSSANYNFYDDIPSYAEVLTNNTAFKSVLEIGSKYAIFTNGTEKVLLFATDKTITSATDLPSDLTQINQYAFSSCSSLTSIEIPSSVTSIGRYAFNGCSSLNYYEYDNAYYLGNSANPYHALIKAKNESITSCETNENTKVIAGGAFSSYSKLTSIEITSSVTSIGPRAFEGCSKLTSVTFKNTTGWWYSSSSTATSGTSLSSSSLANTSTAATYLKSTYSSYYWFRDASDNNTTTVKIYYSNGSEYGTFTTTATNPVLQLHYGFEGGESSVMSLGGVEKINTPVGGFGLSVNNDIDAIDVDDIGRNEAKTLTTGQTYIFYLVWDQDGYNGGGSGAGPIVKSAETCWYCSATNVSVTCSECGNYACDVHSYSPTLCSENCYYKKNGGTKTTVTLISSSGYSTTYEIYSTPTISWSSGEAGDNSILKIGTLTVLNVSLEPILGLSVYNDDYINKEDILAGTSTTLSTGGNYTFYWYYRGEATVDGCINHQWATCPSCGRSYCWTCWGQPTCSSCPSATCICGGTYIMCRGCGLVPVCDTCSANQGYCSYECYNTHAASASADDEYFVKLTNDLSETQAVISKSSHLHSDEE